MSKPIYVTRVISAKAGVVYEKRKKQVGTKTVEGLFSAKEEPVFEEVWEPTDKRSDTWIDKEKLAGDIETTCNNLHEEGYEVIKVTEVIQGMRGWEPYGNVIGSGGAATCASWGYSLTDGIIILAKLRNVPA